MEIFNGTIRAIPIRTYSLEPKAKTNYNDNERAIPGSRKDIQLKLVKKRLETAAEERIKQATREKHPSEQNPSCSTETDRASSHLVNEFVPNSLNTESGINDNNFTFKSSFNSTLSKYMFRALPGTDPKNLIKKNLKGSFHAGNKIIFNKKGDEAAKYKNFFESTSKEVPIKNFHQRTTHPVAAKIAARTTNISFSKKEEGQELVEFIANWKPMQSIDDRKTPRSSSPNKTQTDNNKMDNLKAYLVFSRPDNETIDNEFKLLTGMQTERMYESSIKRRQRIAKRSSSAQHKRQKDSFQHEEERYPRKEPHLEKQIPVMQGKSLVLSPQKKDSITSRGSNTDEREGTYNYLILKAKAPQGHRAASLVSNSFVSRRQRTM